MSFVFINFLLSCKTNNISEDLKHKTNVALAFVVIAALIIFFFVMAKITNILRDVVGNCNDYDANLVREADRTGKDIKSFKRTYSLSRTQLAVWTTLIASTYIYEILCRDCSNAGLNTTALILMGISTGTTAIASLMDSNEIQKGQTRHQDQPSQGFFTDILSYENGISIHRFQTVIWTVIAIIVYMHKIFMNDLVECLPDLNQTLLALTGISSATYLTLRGRENSNPSGNADLNNQGIGKVNDLKATSQVPSAGDASQAGQVNTIITPAIVITNPAPSTNPAPNADPDTSQNPVDKNDEENKTESK